MSRQSVGLQLVRAGILLAILLLIRIQHGELTESSRDAVAPIALHDASEWFPGGVKLTHSGDSTAARLAVHDRAGGLLGYLMQTSPTSDHVVGFSGPTNVLIGVDATDTLVGVKILDSRDTRDHVAQVTQDPNFLGSFVGMSQHEAATDSTVDGVTGATLTSLAIRESIMLRLGGQPFQSLRFPHALQLEDVREWFDTADKMRHDTAFPARSYVLDAHGKALGSVVRTVPHADNVVGYQGPTEARIGFDHQGNVVGIAVGMSYDNEPYVRYVRDDRYFLSLFDDLRLEQIAEIDLTEAGIEGVSGATMTSMAVAEGVIATAVAAQKVGERRRETRVGISARVGRVRDLGTTALTIAGLVIALTSLRGSSTLRVAWQIVLIGYLGLTNGDMVSQALLVGWSQSGVPWTHAGGLVSLTAAALLVPLVSRRNVYCSHLCPHGALQQLVRRRFTRRIAMPRSLRMLRWLPGLLLVVSLVVAMTQTRFSLVDIEPFDAWVWRVAAWPTITIAIVGLLASLYVPMAYCRYGCPTGALLTFLRGTARRDRWSHRDSMAVALLAFAVILWGSI